MKPQRSQRKTLRTLKDITEKIISCVIDAHLSLGLDLLENLYTEAVELER